MQSCSNHDRNEIFKYVRDNITMLRNPSDQEAILLNIGGEVKGSLLGLWEASNVCLCFDEDLCEAPFQSYSIAKYNFLLLK